MSDNEKHFKLFPGENWELQKESDNYRIFLVAEEDVFDRERAFPLNYAIVYIPTNRVEGYIPTLSAALDTVHMLEQSLSQHDLLEEAKTIRFQKPDESEEVH